MNWDNIFYGTIGVVGLMEWVKSFDKKKKLKKIYPVFTLLFSFMYGFSITLLLGQDVFNIGTFILSSGVIMALSVLGYESIIKSIKSKISQIKPL